MAIITETLYINNKEFTRNYSNAGRYVVRDGVSYSEAYDPAEFNRQYTEGEIMEDYNSSSEAEEIVNILTGGADG